MVGHTVKLDIVLPPPCLFLMDVDDAIGQLLQSPDFLALAIPS